MLTRFRIEVQEETAEKCVEALMKYEHALHQQEVRRYRGWWPITLEGRSGNSGTSGHLPEPRSDEDEYPTPEHPWSDGVVPRSFYNERLGREITEEVIEFDSSGPFYRGRRVVAFDRIDTRSSTFLKQLEPTFANTMTAGTLGVPGDD